MKKGNDHIREKKPKRSLKRDELEGWEEKKRRVKIKKGRKRPDHRAREGPKKCNLKKKKPSFFLLSTLHPPHPPSERGVRASHPDKFQPFLKVSLSGLLYGLKI